MKNKEQFFDECPIVNNEFDPKQSGLYKLNGMCFVLEHFPELKKHCPSCTYFKDLPPSSYICKRFYCTLSRE